MDFITLPLVLRLGDSLGGDSCWVEGLSSLKGIFITPVAVFFVRYGFLGLGFGGITTTGSGAAIATSSGG